MSRKNISVYSFLEKEGCINFSRWLPPILFDQWLQILDKVYSCLFTNASDSFVWKWNKSGQFSNKYVYEHLTCAERGHGYKHIWKAKLPYKIKTSIWLLEMNAVLPKENLIKREWTGEW